MTGTIKKRYLREEDDESGTCEVLPPKRRPKQSNTPEKQANPSGELASELRGDFLFDEPTNVFVEQLRHAVLCQDLLEHHLSPVDLTDEAFVEKAASFLHICRDSNKKNTGHAKLDLAFRGSSVFVEGWLYVRHMETNSGQAGFKVRAQGALPLLKFKKEDFDDRKQQQHLNKIMEDVHAVLMEHLLGYCSVLPLQSCDHLWLRVPPVSAGMELRGAVEQAKSIRNMRANPKDTEEAQQTCLEGEDGSYPNGVLVDVFEAVDDDKMAVPDIEQGSDDKADQKKNCGFCPGAENMDSIRTLSKPRTDQSCPDMLLAAMNTLTDSSFQASFWKAVLLLGLAYCLYLGLVGAMQS